MGYLQELSHYSPFDVIGMGFSFIWTRLFYRSATLIRRPFYFRGRKKNLKLGSGFLAGRGDRIELFGCGEIVFGDNCHIGDYVHIVSSSSVKIGKNCLFASKIFISDTSHGNYGIDGCSPDVAPNERPLTSSAVEIGDNVWLGDNVVVLPGVTIGSGCILGANSTVTKPIPPNTIAAGSPAKPIKKYDFSKHEWIKV